MTEFDSFLIGGIGLTVIGFILSFVGEKKRTEQVIRSIIIALIVIALYTFVSVMLAYRYNWESSILHISAQPNTSNSENDATLKPDPVYLVDMDFSDKYGKVYYHDNENANYVNNSDWKDLYTPGHIQRLVCDGYGKTFTYGIHMDGDQLGPYYITFDLDGKYTLFSGWCVMPDYKVGTSDAKTYSKYFEIYCDGKLVFTSNTMKEGSMSQFFEIDITDVDVLTIQYAPTKGPNDLAVLCDGRLS